MTEQESTLTPIKAGRYLGVSEASLRLWRSEGRGPRWFRAGQKLVRYRKTDLDAWVESRLVCAEQYGPLDAVMETVKPEVPEAVKDLIVDLEISQMLSIARESYNADILDAYRRGKAGQ